MVPAGEEGLTSSTDAVAIRIRGLGRYFGPRLEMEGSERPREAWQSLLRIAGIDVTATDDVRATVAVAGHVLRDVSLDIQRGSIVCVTGPPGSGKSVLLQILAGTLPPTAGRVEIYGPVTGLVTVGDNIDSRATAHENIRASPAYVGAAPDEASRYAAEVIEFAELEGFEHVPLRTYSSGMLLRLSVALALCGRHSIVLIDDVLAVGDIAFQQKCVDRLHALRNAGTTLVLAFGDEVLVQQLATRVITLENGRIVSDMPPKHWTSARSASSAADVEWQVLQRLPEDDVMALTSIVLRAARQGEESYVDMSLGFDARLGGVRCRPSVFLMRGKTVLFRTLYPAFIELSGPRRLTFTIRVPTHILPDGRYTLTISMITLRDAMVYSMKADEAVTLTIRRDAPSAADADAESMLALTFPWEIETVAGSTS